MHSPVDRYLDYFQFEIIMNNAAMNFAGSYGMFIFNFLRSKKRKWKSCPPLCDPMDYTLHGILQARILEWVAFPFSRGSSQPRYQTQVSHVAGRFFTSWTTREAQENWSGQPIPSPVDLPDPGIKPGSSALQADSLPTELWGKLSPLIIRSN